MLAVTAHPMQLNPGHQQHKKQVHVLLAALLAIKEHAILAVTAPMYSDLGLLLLKMRIVLTVALLGIPDHAMLVITILAIASLRLVPST
jgi:hypothetical protein